MQYLQNRYKMRIVVNKWPMVSSQIKTLQKIWRAKSSLKNIVLSPSLEETENVDSDYWLLLIVVILSWACWSSKAFIHDIYVDTWIFQKINILYRKNTEIFQYRYRYRTENFRYRMIPKIPYRKFQIPNDTENTVPKILDTERYRKYRTENMNTEI